MSKDEQHPTENPTGDHAKDRRRWLAVVRLAKADAAMRATVDNCVRWASNMLVEVVSNYGPTMPEAKRAHLRAAVMSLGEASLVRWADEATPPTTKEGA